MRRCARRVGLGLRDASRSASIPLAKYLPFQACTVCRETPYRIGTSPTGAPSNTSSTARYRCSINQSRSPEATPTAKASTPTIRIGAVTSMSRGQCVIPLRLHMTGRTLHSAAREVSLGPSARRTRRVGELPVSTCSSEWVVKGSRTRVGEAAAPGHHPCR